MWNAVLGFGFGMRRHGLFVLVVDLNLEKLLNLLGRPHFNGVPGHPLANVHANLAADALVKPNLHVRNDDVNAVRCIARSVLDAVDGAETDARFAARAAIGNDYRKFLRLLFFPRDLGRSFGNDQSRIRFFRIVCHTPPIVA